MKTFFKPLQQHNWCKLLTFVFLLPFTIGSLSSQCNPVSGSISGKVFVDYNNDGIISIDDDGYENVTVLIYDEKQQIYIYIYVYIFIRNMFIYICSVLPIPYSRFKCGTATPSLLTIAEPRSLPLHVSQGGL